MQHTPSLVIFDCDGVLVDSEIVANKVLAEAVTALGWPTTAEESHERFRGRSMAWSLAVIERETGRPIPEGWVEDVHAKVEAEFDEGIEAIPGVHDVVARVAAAEVARCVASSSHMEYLHRVLGDTGLAAHFGEAIYSATMVEHGKPAPDLFLHAAREMGHTPDACAVIEDSLAGVQAGIAAGMFVIGYAGDPHTDAGALEAAGARVVTDMAQVPGLLRLP